MSITGDDVDIFVGNANYISDYTGGISDGGSNPYEGLTPEQINLATFDPIKYYKLPADPWHIVCRWKKDGKLPNFKL